MKVTCLAGIQSFFFFFPQLMFLFVIITAREADPYRAPFSHCPLLHNTFDSCAVLKRKEWQTFATRSAGYIKMSVALKQNYKLQQTSHTIMQIVQISIGALFCCCLFFYQTNPCMLSCSGSKFFVLRFYILAKTVDDSTFPLRL